MNANEIDITKIPAVTEVPDDAVGVSKSYGFVAMVNHHSEKQCSE